MECEACLAFLRSKGFVGAVRELPLLILLMIRSAVLMGALRRGSSRTAPTEWASYLILIPKYPLIRYLSPDQLAAGDESNCTLMILGFIALTK